MRNTAILLITLLVSTGFVHAVTPDSNVSEKGLTVTFEETGDRFTADQKSLIKEIITNSEKKIRSLLPTLPENIQVTVAIIDREINQVGGVTGRANSNSPPAVLVQISKLYPGGVTGAANAGLASSNTMTSIRVIRSSVLNASKWLSRLINSFCICNAF